MNTSSSCRQDNLAAAGAEWKKLGETSSVLALTSFPSPLGNQACVVNKHLEFFKDLDLHKSVMINI